MVQLFSTILLSFFVQLSFSQITFLPRKDLVTLPGGTLTSTAILDYAMLPETLERENYTSTWTLPSGEMITPETQSSDPRILIVNGLGAINTSTNLQHTSLLIQGLSYSDAGVYSCSVQDDRNPGSPPTEGKLELQLILTLTAISSRVTTLDNASSVELSCDMSAYIRPDNQLRWLRWFKHDQLVAIDEDRQQITYMNGTKGGQFGRLSFQPSRVSVLTISNPTLSDSGTYICRVMGTRESLDIELLIESADTTQTTMEAEATQTTTMEAEATQTTMEADTTQTTMEAEATQTIIALSVVLGGFLLIGGLLILATIGISAMRVMKRRRKNQQSRTTEDSPPYDYPEVIPPPLSETHLTQVINDTDYEYTNDVTYKSTMNTVNPAYGVNVSANIHTSVIVDTNIAYGLIESQQQKESINLPQQQNN